MTFDAIIIGAGPAGSTAALSLARMGWSVAVVEKSRFPRRKVCGEFMSATSIAVIDRLGLGGAWRGEAGPEVRRLALLCGERTVEAPMPAAAGFGRALGRDRLDVLLAAAAERAGARYFQPCRALAVSSGDGDRQVRIAAKEGEAVLTAPVVIAAHGSWETGTLATHLEKINAPADFLGFKAHWRNAALPSDLMPLLAFPGGYGGIVWADAGRLSLSCCIRRDVLTRIRRSHAGLSAAQALQRHVTASCRGVREILESAVLDGEWLGAGPIRPGIRPGYAADIFRIGNVAGESHPIIAEGISMAIQSGWLLAAELGRTDARTPAGRAMAGRRYEAAWRAQFAMRIRAAGVFAAFASRPRAARLMGAAAGAIPPLLTLGARLSGKSKPVRSLLPSSRPSA